ncbi:hypothetical protein CGCF415_v008162 [Colletotrichum fructicola]|nr:hypothetical protein CGCFRS4_v004555 [Colletotrichum fructicola]KAF4905710.1 hypothetical protein CGCF415_v008162 [Colletotrichum fructicola]KAF4938021.1 hypothetical protein CGCF245_v005112 [Colletotrichum fructicola]
MFLIEWGIDDRVDGLVVLGLREMSIRDFGAEQGRPKWLERASWRLTLLGYIGLGRKFLGLRRFAWRARRTRGGVASNHLDEATAKGVKDTCLNLSIILSTSVGEVCLGRRGCRSPSTTTREVGDALGVKLTSASLHRDILTGTTCTQVTLHGHLQVDISSSERKVGDEQKRGHHK